MARFERFVALRYLRGAQGREEGRRFLRFITHIATGGVAVGVAALLLSLAVVRGFSREIEEKIVGFGAHVQVESIQDEPLSGASALRDRIQSMEGVTSVAPVIQEFMLLRASANAVEGVVLWGAEAVPEYLREHLVAGSTEFNVNDGASGGVIGQALARLMGLSVGDKVAAFSMRRLRASGESVGNSFNRPRVKQFVVSGIYETSLENFDEIYVFAELEEVRVLSEYAPDEVTRYDVSLTDVTTAGQIANRIEEEIGFPVMARSIYEVWRGLFAWVELQESIIPLVIGVIILVAAFNIVGALLMIILEKTREIGVLESMGASSRSLRRLFLWLGLLIGIVGTAIGEGLALVLALIQQRYGIIPLPPEAYYMDTAPIELNLFDFVLVAVVTLTLCALAAYVPARVAAAIDPIRVIRFR